MTKLARKRKGGKRERRVEGMRDTMGKERRKGLQNRRMTQKPEMSFPNYMLSDNYRI